MIVFVVAEEMDLEMIKDIYNAKHHLKKKSWSFYLEKKKWKLKWTIECKILKNRESKINFFKKKKKKYKQEMEIKYTIWYSNKYTYTNNF